MGYLTRALKSLHNNSDFDYHPSCKKQRTIQLSFTDDLASGLVVNVDKSNVYFGGVKQDCLIVILYWKGSIGQECTVCHSDLLGSNIFFAKKKKYSCCRNIDCFGETMLAKGIWKNELPGYIYLEECCNRETIVEIVQKER
ncbi:hypothetical protein H5410_051491 [Solanum commersonii]|uniref:Uncharacterized protein n=1 Tax=Solanum commersonii TaxID=4109 RepID=A0A9J5X151_SOLCO|nr:hypothetical protein H5410_051491 [Solanum commersonii]